MSKKFKRRRLRGGKEVDHKCPRCHNMTSYQGEFGDDKKSPCPICEGDEQAHASWERDNFGG